MVNLRRSSIRNWFASLRTVTSDTLAQTKAIRTVYAQIAQGSAAMSAINDFYRGDPPQERRKTETVSAEFNTVLPTSDRSYEVDWTETTRDIETDSGPRCQSGPPARVYPPGAAGPAQVPTMALCCPPRG